MQAEEISKSAQFGSSGKYIKFKSQLLCQWTHKGKLYVRVVWQAILTVATQTCFSS